MAIESWVVYQQHMCAGELETSTLEDELHTGVPLLLKTNLTAILPPYMLRVWVIH